MNPPSTPSKPVLGHKTRRIIEAFLVLTVERDHGSEGGRGIKTSCKFIFKSNQSEEEANDLDETSIGLMCLPDGVETLKHHEGEPFFHTFVVTRENGVRVFGSSLLVSKRHQTTRDVSLEAFCLMTRIPFVVCTQQLLGYFLHFDLDSPVIQRVCRLKLPAKGKCLKVLLPSVPHPTIRGYNDCTPDPVFIFRGTSDFPLLDYPLRRLFRNVLNPFNLMQVLLASLLEFQVLIISNDYQEMMLVSECLTSLLLPFQWQHVYVPILPSQLGLHYLDAPTPYIMGIHSGVFSTACSAFPSLTTHTSQARVFCSENKIEFIPGSDLDFEGDVSLSSMLPAWMSKLSDETNLILESDVKLVENRGKLRSEKLVSQKQANEVAHKVDCVNDTNFGYLDDLKLNHVLRVLFTTTLEQNLVKDVHKFIDSSSSSVGNNNRQGVKFDDVSFLSDQPEKDILFFKRFIDTQMFASIIDTRFRRNPSSKRFTSSRETTFSIENLKQLKESVDKVYDGAFEDATVVDLKESDISKSCLSPRSQRKVYRNLHTVNNNKESLVPSKEKMIETTNGDVAFVAQNNWRIVESLLIDTRNKTKRILLEKMDRNERTLLPYGLSEEEIEGNALIASLCDLIEKVWSHGRINESPTGSSFWQSLSTFSRNQITGQSSISTDKVESLLNNLTVNDQRGSYSLLSASHSRSTPSSPMKSRPERYHSSANHSLLDPLPVSLTRDILAVQRMGDIKTDAGKSRAFIRLSLEKKSLSQHLREVLEHEDLSLTYNKFAFLRSEEEKEQFLTHLLTLNAVDILCFTNSFITSFLSEFC